MEDSSAILTPEGDDILVRLILHPREIVKETGLFAEEQLLSPTKLDSKSKKSPVVWSVGLRKAFATETDVHLYGCRTAEASREDRYRKAVAVDSTATKAREPNYLGFYQFVHSALLGVKQDNADVAIEQKTEHGEVAHCNITLTPKENVARGDWSDARTKFIAAMGALLSGPLRFICEVDDDLRPVLEKIDLPGFPRSTKPTTT